MPYIKQDRRKILDPYIEALCDRLMGTMDPGELNYAITRLVAAQFLAFPSYQRIATLTGVLDNVKHEFTVRLVDMYEYDKCLQNGDLEEFAAFDSREFEVFNG